jgi:hypothetical protein
MPVPKPVTPRWTPSRRMPGVACGTTGGRAGRGGGGDDPAAVGQRDRQGGRGRGRGGPRGGRGRQRRGEGRGLRAGRQRGAGRHADRRQAAKQDRGGRGRQGRAYRRGAGQPSRATTPYVHNNETYRHMDALHAGVMFSAHFPRHLPRWRSAAGPPSISRSRRSAPPSSRGGSATRVRCSWARSPRCPSATTWRAPITCCPLDTGVTGSSATTERVAARPRARQTR